MNINVKFSLTKQMIVHTIAELIDRDVKRIGKKTIEDRIKESLLTSGSAYFDYYEERNGAGYNEIEEIYRIPYPMNGKDGEDIMPQIKKIADKYWVISWNN